MLSDEELLRYSRQILLKQVDIEGQLRLKQSRALIVGLGGLGSPVALYLAAAGVGELHLADFDTLDLTNLQRQIAHTTARVGQPKASSAAQAIHDLNPEIQVHCIQQRADAALLDELVAQATVVLDCCDNYRTRQAVNAACVRHRVPLVAGAIIRLDGQITVFDPRREDSPCYACLFAPEADFEEVQCSTMGVLAPLVGIIGCMQAAEALKLIANFGESLTGKLLILDGRSMEWSRMRTSRNPDCSICCNKK